MVSVYLSSQYIHVVMGSFNKRAKLRRVVRGELPSGLLSSGTVVDGEGLKTFLTEFWKRNKLPRKNIILVLSSSQLMNKAVEAPAKLKERELMDFLNREFTDYARSGSSAFGCWPMSGNRQKKTQRLLATAAGRDYLNEVVEVFTAARIGVKEIVSELSGVLAALLRIRELEKGAAVVQWWNGMSLMNVLLVEGSYVYSNSNIMPYEPGTAAFAVGAARQISKLQQFMQANQITARLEQVYLVGMSQEDVSLCADSIYQMDASLKVDSLPDSIIKAGKKSGDFHGCLAAIGALTIAPGKLGLRYQMGQDEQTVAEKAAMRKRLTPAVIMAGIAILACLVTYGIHWEVAKQLKELTDFNTNPVVVAQVQEYNDLQQRNEELQRQLRQLEADAAAIASHPLPNSQINRVLSACAQGLVETQALSYSAQTGVFSTVTTSENEENINYFAARLQQEEIFRSVTYTGFSYNYTTGKWTVNFVCTLAPTAGR